MKKWWVTLMLLVFPAFAIGCGNSEEEEPAPEEQAEVEDVEEADETDEDESEAVDVDKGLLNVEVTVPASMVDDEEETLAEAEENGIKDAVVNSDGSVTYKMTKSQHRELLAEYREEVEEMMAEFVENEDFASIEDIKGNKDFTEFTLTVDREKFEESLDGFATFSLGIAGLYYQLFDGVDPDNYSVSMHMADSETGETFDTVVFPDDFEDMGVE